jgi:hypothetical protein
MRGSRRIEHFSEIPFAAPESQVWRLFGCQSFFILPLSRRSLAAWSKQQQSDIVSLLHTGCVGWVVPIVVPIVDKHQNLFRVIQLDRAASQLPPVGEV